MTRQHGWIWQRENWTDFQYASDALEELEANFLKSAGELIGSVKHIGEHERYELTVELISDEAFKTSEIEGEILNRASLQSSIRRQFGLKADDIGISPAERGIAEVLTNLYLTCTHPLSQRMLFDWHELICLGRKDLDCIGSYRQHEQPMQIVSGYMHEPTIHYEAPPSHAVPSEMDSFIDWFNATEQDEKQLPALTRAGLAHLRFELIHPFEDGNGRIGRAIAEKALSQNLGRPSLIALSQTIHEGRKRYYAELEKANSAADATDWLIYFAETILTAQARSLAIIDFLIKKTRFFDFHRAHLNERQTKALLRMFKEGPDGFTGGLSAANYVSITKTSTASASRDLNNLVNKGALKRTGKLKGTRYHLNI